MNDQPAPNDEVSGVADDPPSTPEPRRQPNDSRRWVVESDATAQAEDLDSRDSRQRRANRVTLSKSSPEPGPAADAAGTDAAAADGAAADGAAAESDDAHATAVQSWRERSKKRNNRGKRPFWIELPILIVIAFALTFLIQTFIAKVYYVPSGSMEKTLHGVQSGGDRILASKIVYDFRDPHEGDVVVFQGPDTWNAEADIPGPSTWLGKVAQSLGSVIGIAPPNEKDFVKRVIAVGGQTVACCDKQGNVTVDGRSLNEPYLYQPWPFVAGDPSQNCTVSADGLSYASQRCFAPFKVPDGQLWVMGDHRSMSADSSYECWGKTAAAEKIFLQDSGTDCNRPIPVGNVIGKAIFIVMPPSRWGTIGDPDIDPQNPALSDGATAAVPAAGGVLLTLGLRGGLALTPTHRRRRRSRRGDGSRRGEGRRRMTGRRRDVR